MGLLDKMYEDSKYAAKERSKQNEINKKRAENQKRQQEAKAEAERKKKEAAANKPMERWEKMTYTIVLMVLTLFSVPLSLYFSASLLNKLRKANGANAAKELGLPDDPVIKPYTKKTSAQVNAKIASDNKAFSASISDSQKGGRRKKYQRGGNIALDAANEAKGFTDSTKYGAPYSLATNDNPIIADFGQYFITYFSFVRGISVKCLKFLNDSFFKNFDPSKGNGSSVGDKLIDWGVMAIIMPILVFATNIITWLSGSVALFWSAINNQSIGAIFWSIFAGCTFFFGGNWPTSLLIIYKDLYLAFRGSNSTMNTFREYFSRYKFWWTFVIVALWGLWIYGFMGGGFGKKITKEPDFQIWMWAGCYAPLICVLIGILGFAALF